MKTERKTASEKLLVDFLWDERVSTSTWAADDGVTLSGADTAAEHSYVFVSSGTLGTTYQLTNTVTLSNNEVLQRSILVQVVSK